MTENRCSRGEIRYGVRIGWVVASFFLAGALARAQEEIPVQPVPDQPVPNNQAVESIPPPEAAAEAPPQEGEAALPGASLERLEWRGVMTLGDEVRFSLHDPAQEAGFWITFADPRFGVEVESYDAEENILTLRAGEESRALSLAGSTVAASSPPDNGIVQPSDSSPLVQTPAVLENEAGPDAEELPAEVAMEARQVADRWQQAIQEVPRLREIAVNFQELRLESQRLEEAMTQVPQDAPEYQALQTRQQQVQAEERMLTEMALGEVQASPGLRDQLRLPLREALRDEVFGSPVQPRPAATSDQAESAEEPEVFGEPEPEAVDEAVPEEGTPEVPIFPEGDEELDTTPRDFVE